MKKKILIALVGAFISSHLQAENIVSGDITISDKTFETELALMTKQNRMKYLSSLPNAGLLVNDLYSRMKLTREAEARNLQDDPQVKYQLERARQYVLADALRKNIEQNIEFPDFEPLARQDYNLNKDKFWSKEEVNASHILIKASESGDNSQRLATAKGVLAELKTGANFAELAKAKSDDTASGQRGGNLGWFAHGRMVKPFEDAAFALKNKGDLSGIVETQYGFHIIKLNDKRSGKQLSFDEAKDAIILRLAQQYREREVSRLLKELSDPSGADANIEVLDKSYQAARAKYLKNNKMPR